MSGNKKIGAPYRYFFILGNTPILSSAEIFAVLPRRGLVVQWVSVSEEVAVIADLAGHRSGDLVTLTVVPPQGFKVLGTSVNQVRVMGREPQATTPPSEAVP